MARRGDSVLVDTNAIIEAHRCRVLAALGGALWLETVERCVAELHTGAHKRPAAQRIVQASLDAVLAKVHEVSERERAEVLMRDAQMSWLDAGERDLWAHALTRSDAWVLCGPDAASLRVGIRLGFRDRLVSLEAVCANAGCRPAQKLRRNYTSAWHAQKVQEMAVQEGRWP
jgi:predicted nucleic acid-binding protein